MKIITRISNWIESKMPSFYRETEAGFDPYYSSSFKFLMVAFCLITLAIVCGLLLALYAIKNRWI